MPVASYCHTIFLCRTVAYCRPLTRHAAQEMRSAISFKARTRHAIRCVCAQSTGVNCFLDWLYGIFWSGYEMKDVASSSSRSPLQSYMDGQVFACGVHTELQD
ncbi:hypothetical protein B0H11DRAFT_1077635 [Mycena galericulata]|nr:hypothetical protein B0H11DRAFT_1077635 [Mycena galericulata]